MAVEFSTHRQMHHERVTVAYRILRNAHHDRGDEDSVRVLLLQSLELSKHRLKGPVADKLKVLRCQGSPFSANASTPNIRSTTNCEASLHAHGSESHLTHPGGTERPLRGEAHLPPENLVIAVPQLCVARRDIDHLLGILRFKTTVACLSFMAPSCCPCRPSEVFTLSAPLTSDIVLQITPPHPSSNACMGHWCQWSECPGNLG